MANSVDLNQTAPSEEQFDQGLHCLPFYQIFLVVTG